MSGVDGRRLRAQRTKTKIVMACRGLMLAGTYRPTVYALAAKAGISVRTVFERFDDVEHVYVDAIAEPFMRDGILQNAVGSLWTAIDIVARDRIVEALVLSAVAPCGDPRVVATFHPERVVTPDREGARP